MGMNLIHILARQLGGSLSLINQDGLCVRVHFTVDEETKHLIHGGAVALAE